VLYNQGIDCICTECKITHAIIETPPANDQLYCVLLWWKLNNAADRFMIPVMVNMVPGNKKFIEKIG